MLKPSISSDVAVLMLELSLSVQFLGDLDNFLKKIYLSFSLFRFVFSALLVLLE